jgi:glycosyltransferase involved in cell wall biosynthesis
VSGHTRNAGAESSDSIPRTVVVGSGTRFISGISYYTYKLALALSERCDVAVVLMRQIIPRRFYPGRERVGARITELEFPAGMAVLDGVDWHGLGLLRAVRLLTRFKADYVVFQWWTGAVLHLYVVLALVARISGAKVIVEFHETQDTGETKVAGAAAYVRAFSRMFTGLAAAAVVHSESDVQAVSRTFGMGGRPIVVIPHGPFDHHMLGSQARLAPAGVVNVLFFGTIRPYKGLEDLVEAFNSLEPENIDRYWLTVVGETWEGWDLPSSLIESSRYRERITFVNRYVTDEELNGYLAGADVVALPYRRSSASGPLHVTMSAGIPVVVTSVGGLPEAAQGYGGAVFVPPAEPTALREGLARAAELVGTRFADPHSWSNSAEKYVDLFKVLDRKGT